MRKLIPLLALLMTACVPQPAPPMPSATPTLTEAPTATIVWFPPTETPTPRPTQPRTPTPDPRSGTGELLVMDVFDSGEDWSLVSTSNTRVAVANGHLSLVLSNPRSYLFTTRQQPIVYDFYAEITASANLCSPADEYGLMVRISNSLDYYRFGLSCDGRARVDRLFRGAVNSIQPWEQQAVILGGFPGSNRLGVWAYQDEIRFFINDVLIYTIPDRVLGPGTFGVFVHTAGDSTISVNFSDLQIWQVAP